MRVVKLGKHDVYLGWSDRLQAYCFISSGELLIVSVCKVISRNGSVFHLDRGNRVRQNYKDVNINDLYKGIETVYINTAFLKSLGGQDGLYPTVFKKFLTDVLGQTELTSPILKSGYLDQQGQMEFLQNQS